MNEGLMIFNALLHYRNLSVNLSNGDRNGLSVDVRANGTSANRDRNGHQRQIDYELLQTNQCRRFLDYHIED